MTRLLVSVRSVVEAEAALAGGADIIDVKEPRRGPLGRADDVVIKSVIEVVAGRVPVSAALGELSQGTPPPEGLTFAKVGLADEENWQLRWQQWRSSLPCLAVLVAYVDRNHLDNILRFALVERPPALLLDTAKKCGPQLLDFVSLQRISEIMQLCCDNGILCALAGSLDEDSIAQLLPMSPDIIAVRGAVCDGGRDGVVTAQRVAALANLIHLAHSSSAG